MVTENSPRVAFLGCGSMNEAILAGVLAGGYPRNRVTATVRRPERAGELASRHGIEVLAEGSREDANRAAAETADVIIVGVKPVGVQALLKEISPALAPHTVVISVAAAITVQMLEAALPAGQPVIRSMPNTPSKLGRGVVSLSAGTSCGADALDLARALLAPAGTVVEIPEEQVDALSAVSGSGPAYAFYLAEAMAAAGEKLGLDPQLSAMLARETVAGAGAMLAEPDADATALRRAVTSPNGTTEAAIAVFDRRGLPDVVADGAAAAAARAAEISAELSTKD